MSGKHRARATSSDTIPFIEGDGTGPDIWRASVRVFDAAVAKAYGGARAIEWLEVLAGEKAFKQTGNWLPEETLAAFRKYLVGIKGPADDAGRRRHPIAQRRAAAGTRSLRVPAARSLLQGHGDAGQAARPRGHGDLPREHRRHLRRHRVPRRHAGGRASSRSCSPRRSRSCTRRFGSRRRPAFGIKPISREGSERLIRAAIEYAVANKRKSLTLVHKGNIMKFTEGAFRDWGYDLAKREFGAVEFDGGPVVQAAGRPGRSRTSSPTRSCSRS